ncbi:MAG: PTS sugar transporter subunit IIA [Pseudoclavibacter sp.]
MSPQATQVRFGGECTRLGERAESWRDAVTAAGRVLESIGATMPGYGKRMLGAIDSFGPYVVVAPGIALVHARPGPDVLENAAAVLTFPEGVSFGHPENDPVRVVVALAVTKPDEHVKIIAVLARLLDNDGAVQFFLDASDANALAESIVEKTAPLRVIDADGNPARRRGE